MAVTRIKNNQITDAITGNTIVGINANTKVQPYSITSNLLANNFTYGSDFTISGNLSVTGTTTAVDTTYTNIQDPLIVLADGQTSGAPAVDIGYIGLRGNQSNIAFVWREANAEFSTVYTSTGEDASNTTVAISSFADFKSNNVSTISDVSAGGNIYANVANVNTLLAGNVSVSGNITFSAYGNISTTGNVDAGNVNVASDLSVGGNILANNISAGGNVVLANVSISGNVTISGTGNISTGGNINANNVSLGGNIDVSGYGNILGNVSLGSELSVQGNITATGNIGSGSYLFGDGYYISNINAGNVNTTKIVFGGSYANVIGSNANVVIAVGPTSNVVATFYDQGVNFDIDVSASGNILAGSNVSAGGNVTGGNLNTTGSGGNIVGSGWVLAGHISATSEVLAGTDVSAGGNIYSQFNVSAGGNVNGNNINSGTDVSAQGNLYAGNVNVTGGGNVSTTGRVWALGVSVTGNIRVDNSLFAGNVSTNGTVYGYSMVGTEITAQGNVVAGNVYAGIDMSAGGNITALTGTLQVGYANITNDLNTDNAYAMGNISAGGNISAVGNLYGSNVVTNFLDSANSTLQISAAGTNAGISLFTNGGNIGVSSNYINGVLSPMQAQDAANKEYVDSVATGLQVKSAVVVATVAPLPAYTYNQPNGAGNGVGATLTASSAGNLFIDGVQISTLNERVLIQSETAGNAAYNGIYTVTTVPDATTAYVLTRSTDFDMDPQAYGAYMLVQQGNTLAGTGQVCTNNAASSPITFGVTAITFSEFSAPTQYQQGNGIQISGLTISTRINTGNLEYDGNGNLQVSSSAQFYTPNIGTATGTSLSTTGDVNSNNVGTTNNVSAGGNVYGSYVNSTNDVSAGGNVYGSYVNSTNDVSAGGNVYGTNVSATTNVLAGSDVSAGGNVLVTTNVSAGGNIIGNYVNATNNVSAGGNVIGGNLFTTGSNGNISGAGWVIAGNVTTYGNILAGTDISAYGNIFNQGNISTAGNITATGNIGTAQYLFGDGAYISNINAANVSSTKISNGGSYANVTAPSGNVVIAVGAGSNIVATFYDTGVNLNGDASVGGNVLTGAGISAYGDITAGGNVVGGNVNSNSNVSAGGNVWATVDVSAGGNVNGNNVNSTNDMSAGGNIYAANFATTGSGGNITGANVVSAVTFTATGNIYANALVNTNLYSANLTSPLGTNGYAIQGGATNYSQLYVGGTAGAEGVNIYSLGGEPVTINTGAAGANTYNWSFSSSDGSLTAPGNIQASSTFLVDTTDNTVLMGNVTNLVTDSVLTLNSTNSFVVPVGNTAQRPPTPYTGMMRFNTTTNQMEVYNNSEWASVGSSIYTVITDEQFNGDGATVTFTLSSSQTTSSCIVSINGVVQIPTLAYAVSGTTLTFTEAPAIGDVIDVRELTTTTTVTYISNTSGNATVSANYQKAEVEVTGNLVAQLNAAAPTLTANSTLSFQLVNDTTLAFIVRGTDGTTRTATVTLS